MTDFRDTGWEYPDLFSIGALIMVAAIFGGPLIIMLIGIAIAKIHELVASEKD